MKIQAIILALVMGCSACAHSPVAVEPVEVTRVKFFAHDKESCLSIGTRFFEETASVLIKSDEASWMDELKTGENQVGVHSIMCGVYATLKVVEAKMAEPGLSSNPDYPAMVKVAAQVVSRGNKYLDARLQTFGITRTNDTI